MKHLQWSVLWAALAFLSLAVSTPTMVLAVPARPNVLFIAIDDLRTEIGCYGADHVRTPNIDRLAAQGMRFDRAYVQAAFCNPSRASFLTGLRPDVTNVLDNGTWFRRNLPDAVTLPQMFKQNGHYTMRLGKIFHGTQSMDDPQGWHQAVYPQATERGLRGEGRNLTDGKVKWCRWKAAEGDDLDQPDGQIARLAVAFLKERHEQPLFLAIGVALPLALLETYRGQLLLDARDVGPSAGYHGCLGLAVAGLSSRKREGVFTGIILVLALRLTWRTIVGLAALPRHQSVRSYPTCNGGSRSGLSFAAGGFDLGQELLHQHLGLF